MVSFSGNNVASAFISPVVGNSENIRLVKGQGDKAAFVVPDVTGNRLFVKKSGSSDLVSPLDVTGDVVNLVVLSDESYLFVRSLSGEVFHYRFDQEGIQMAQAKTLMPSETGFGSQAYSLIVLPDDSFVLVSSKVNLVAPFSKFTQKFGFNLEMIEVFKNIQIHKVRDEINFTTFSA